MFTGAMFPRRTSLCRYAIALLTLTLLLYTGVSFLVTSSDTRDVATEVRSINLQLGGMELAVNSSLNHELTGVSPTRHFTQAKTEAEDGKPEEPHRHNANHTLEELRKNMTLLKVNMSGLANIVQEANQSGLVDQLNVPHPHPFRYIINSPKICRDKDLFLIVYIHTAPDHYKRRTIIRQTWGNPSYYNVSIRLVFVMGQTENKPELQQALYFEQEQYGDIVQEDFIDSYRNLTYKGIAALKWISTYCHHPKYVLKTDDDIFVNMFTLTKHLQSLHEHSIDNRGLLMCLVWNRMKVMRTGKWKVAESEWNDEYYPTYCSGSAFTMSTDVAIALHNISYFVPFFWVDDFYITGLLPLKHGNIKHKQFMSTYVLDGKKLEEKFTGPQWFTYIFSHVHNLNSIQSVWNKLVQLSRGQTVAKVMYVTSPTSKP